MRLGRRVSAGLCALALMAALVAYPLRARAMSSAVLASVGGATVIAATLAACGIYPYASAGESSFGEWGARALTNLLEQYNQAHVESALRMEQVRGYVVGKTVVIARETWEKLRSFVSWCRESFGLADNQTGVSVGEISVEGYCPVFNGYPTREQMLANGVYVASYDGTPSLYALSSVPNIIVVGTARNAGTAAYPKWSAGFWFFSFSNPGSADMYYSFSASHPNGSVGHTSNWEAYKDIYYVSMTTGVFSYFPFDYQVPYFTSLESAYQYVKGYTPETSLSGVTADTATVSELAEAPEGADFVGLSVSPGTVTGVADAGIGADAGTGNSALVENPATVMTPQAVERIIQQGVTERQRPVVRPVEVEVASGVEVDEETGELVAAEPGTVTITETDIPLSLGDYAIPSLSTVFPFSIPWDIMRIWQALDAEPRFPLQDFSMTLNVPLLFGDSPPTVRFGLDAFPEDVAAKMDDVALVVRYSLLLVACVGFLIFISQFIKW